jgi:hypothetical protein
MTALSSTTLSGYVDTSAQWNVGTGNHYLPNIPLTGPTKADGFNLNLVRLVLEKPVDQAEAWGAGYKVDLVAGPDANVLNTLSTSSAVQSVGGNNSDFAVKQAYVDLRAPLGNGLDAKVGVFDTITGYEVFTSPDNPNFTRSYGWGFEPTTHTGILLGYQFNDMISANAGVANTFGPTINGKPWYPGYARAESYKAYMGSVTFSMPTNWGTIGGSTISGAIINGFNSSEPATDGTFTVADQTSYYVGGTFNTPVTGLKVGVAYDYEGVSKQPLTGQKSAYAEAASLYLSYQATEKLTLNTRGEYAWASHGNPVFIATTPGVPAPATIPTAVFAITETVQYDLWKNVLARVEFRWDHAASSQKLTPGADDDVYGGSDTSTSLRDDSFILLANFVYKF